MGVMSSDPYDYSTLALYSKSMLWIATLMIIEFDPFSNNKICESTINANIPALQRWVVETNLL